MSTIISIANIIGEPSPRGIVPLLLDQYPGAAAAYSLRKLRTDYSGAAIRVRESLGNTEADIGFNADGSLNTTALLAHTGANNGFVTTWYDQSGNARNATQAIAASQPQIVSSGSVVLENGEPAIDFDGINDRVVSSAVAIPQPYTIIATAKFNAPSANEYIVVLDVGSNALIGTDATPNFRIFAGFSLTDGLANTNQSVFFGSFNGATSLLAVNGSSITGNAGTGAGSLISIGDRGSGSFPADAKIQEVIVYPTNQSANRIAIESNINNYYNIYP